jgi:hypothetical protein
LSLEDIGLKLVAGSRQVQFGAAEDALDLRAHGRDRKMIISHLLVDVPSMKTVFLS